MLCSESDLLPNAGVCALYRDEQVALFYLPDSQPQLYAINKWGPIGFANVLSRGIVGDVNGRAVVASPLYKQHYDLLTGQCMEDKDVVVRTYPVDLVDGKVVVKE